MGVKGTMGVASSPKAGHQGQAALTARVCRGPSPQPTQCLRKRPGYGKGTQKPRLSRKVNNSPLIKKGGGVEGEQTYLIFWALFGTSWHCSFCFVLFGRGLLFTNRCVGGKV